MLSVPLCYLLRLSSFVSSICVFGLATGKGNGWWWGDVTSSPGLIPFAELLVSGMVTLELERALLWEWWLWLAPKRPGPEHGRRCSPTASRRLAISCCCVDGKMWLGLDACPMEPGVESSEGSCEAASKKKFCVSNNHLYYEKRTPQLIKRKITIKLWNYENAS